MAERERANVENHFFDSEALAVLLEPARWTLLGTGFPDPSSPCRHHAHRQWMREHTERHPAREIVFAVKGNGRYGFKDRVLECPPGTAIFFDSYEPHDAFYPPFAGPWMHLWLGLFDHDAVVRLLRVEAAGITNTEMSLALTDDPAASLLSSAWDEARSDSERPVAFRRARLRAAFLTLMTRIVGEGYAPPPSLPAVTFQRQVIATIRRHVAETAGRDVPLAEAARLSGYSKFHFLRLFKQETGKTFHDYVNECRRKTANAMLLEGRTKASISQALGFSHPSSFLRWMKTRGGVSARGRHAPPLRKTNSRALVASS